MESARIGQEPGADMPTILLVDDDDSARTATRRMIERLGFRVVAVADGRQALDVFAADPGRFQCAVLDLAMPALDGERCFHELRRVQPELPIVVTSGADEVEMEARLAGETAAAFLQKPYLKANLEEKLRSLIT
jgi:two-component system cell cycle sensor histidine kinase/response regulator CckA